MSHMIVRMTSSGREGSPGPAGYNTNKRLGSDAPAWTIPGIHHQKDVRVSGEFCEIGSTIGNCPTIHMHHRTETKKNSDTPGPAFIPPSIGSDARKSTVAPRLSARSIDTSPGPKYYPRKQEMTKKYSIKGRNYLPEAEPSSPGPAEYTPNIFSTRRAPRTASIGIRTDPLVAKSQSPGPSQYSVSRDLGGKSATLHCRHREAVCDDTPGPAAYYPQCPRVSSPKYSISSRSYVPEQKNDAGYVALPTTVGEGPKIHLSFRHKQSAASKTPGPSYVPPGLNSARGATIGHRLEALQRDITPGPGQYAIADEKKTKISIKSRARAPDGGSMSPGPAAYDPKISQVKRTIPSPTIGNRFPDKDGKEGAKYVALPSTLCGPRYSIGLRETCGISVV